MELFRAVPVRELPASYPRAVTKRTPSHVPYLVDNIWEWLRPKGNPTYPSRRFATYASPTRELALESAYAPVGHINLMACRLVAGDNVPAVQLAVSDARNHRDVKVLTRVVLDWAEQAWIDGPLDAKLSLGALFLPVVDAGDVDQMFDRIPRGDELRVALRARSTFWADATLLTGEQMELPSQIGEIFLDTSMEGYCLEA